MFRKNIEFIIIKLKYFLVVISLLVSCKSRVKELFQFDPVNFIERNTFLSELGDDITYVPLDSNIVLGRNYFPIVFDGKQLYYYNYEGIFVFNKDGEFVKRIGKKGRGPGELIYGMNFSVDENTGTTYILDSKNTVKIYSVDGDYKGNISLNSFIGSIDCINVYNTYIFSLYNIQLNDGNDYEWVVYDTLGKVIQKKQRMLPQFTSNYLAGGGTYIYNKNLYYWNQFLDTVFTVFPDFTYKPSFVFVSGEYRLPKVNIDDPINRLHQYMIIEQIIETKHFIMIRYSHFEGKNGFVLVDKSTQESLLSYWEYEQYGSIVNDIDGGPDFLPRGYFVENGREYLVGFIDPYNIKNWVEKDDFLLKGVKSLDKKQLLIKLADSLEETDNPILVIVRLKN
jgi:hypothetical protein